MGMRTWAATAAMAVGVSMAPAALPSAGAATGVCTGVSGCTVVSRADVDGDGRADQVGVVQRGLSSPPTKVTVRVRTAKGRTLTTSHEAWWYGRTTWHGAARMDGRAGYELVVGSSVGAHYMSFTVITYRNGRLTTLRAPGNAYRWGIDSSYSFNEGWTRTVSRAGTVAMTRRHAQRRTESTHILRTKRYIWRSGAWVRTSSRTTVVSDRTGSTVGGWRVPYLKRYPTF